MRFHGTLAGKALGFLLVKSNDREECNAIISDKQGCRGFCDRGVVLGILIGESINAPESL